MARRDKRQLNAWLSAEAREGLEEACLKAGVSMTAVLEALGMALYTGDIGPREQWAGVWARLVEYAKTVDAARRGRRSVDLREAQPAPRPDSIRGGQH